MERINKAKARKLFNQGKEIYMIPCNMNLYNPWIKPACISKKDDDTFDHLVNAFEWYNCYDSECGFYAHYYVEEGD